MKYYTRRSGSGKMSKVLFRIFFVICAALVIVILSAMLGNHLKNKIAAAEEAMKASGEAAGIQLSREPADTPTEITGSAYAMKAGGIDLTAYTSDGDMLSALDTLSSYYSTLIIPVCREDGTLIYSSPALEKISRSEVSADNTVFDLLSSCTAAAKNKGMEVCALLTPSDGISSPSNAAFVDSALISELYENGADRVILKFSESGDENYPRWIQNYISAMDFDEDKLGIALPSDYVLEARGVQQLQLFSERGAFLCVYFDSAAGSYDTVYDSVTHKLGSMVGMFELYTVTVLVSPNNNIPAVYKACTDAGVKHISFTGYTLPDDLVKKLDTTEEATEDTAEPEQQKITNPYAGSSFSTPETETETETDYDYSSGYYDDYSGSYDNTGEALWY